MKRNLILTSIFSVVVIAISAQFTTGVASLDLATTEAANEIPPVQIPQHLGQSDEAGPEVKLMLLGLLPHGFETDELQVEAGDYLFIFGNLTGMSEVNLRLEREGKERLAEATAVGRQRKWKKRLKLTPGNYVVTANDNPEWTCRIVVRP
jgi:hypothetical protein